jgi:hypothetical protein
MSVKVSHLHGNKGMMQAIGLQLLLLSICHPDLLERHVSTEKTNCEINISSYIYYYPLAELSQRAIIFSTSLAQVSG